MDLKALVLDYLNDNEDAMKKMITWFFNEVMDKEAEIQVGALPYERTEARNGRRNGHRTRSLRTRYGKIKLNKPVLRGIPFVTQVFERYSRTEKALECAILESYLQGVSTRKVEEVVQYLGVEKISPSYVSKLAQELDEKVKEFFSRPIDSFIPYLFVDASYFKVREGSRYVSKALLVIAGVRSDGYREIIGARIADCESELTWEDLFADLKERGLERVELIISDGHKGIQTAAERSFPGSSWQMCLVHFIRTVLRKIPKNQHREISNMLKNSLHDSRRLQECADELYIRGFSRASETIERLLPGLLNYTSASFEHWTRIRTTNLLERVNKELKRRSRVIGAFPNDNALVRLAGSLLMDINEEWITGRRYLSVPSEMSSLDTGSKITAD